MVSSRFGSWNAALVAAGLPAQPYGYSDEEVIEALRADALRLGRTPTLDDWRGRGPAVPGIGAVITHFGSWNVGLRAAGLTVTREYGVWTRERLLAALRRDAARRGRTPVREDWSKATRSRPNAATVAKFFGSWNAGLRAAGLEPNVERDKWTEVTVLKALRELERELGRQPTSSDVTRPPGGYPNNAVIKRKLGSWGAACRALGWHAEPRVISDDHEMLDALKAAAAELGATFPHQRYKAISAARGWPSANAITARFGSWNAARESAGLPVPRPQRRDWSAEQLARALRSAARRLGRTPMAKDWDRLAPDFGWPHSATRYEKARRRLMGAGDRRGRPRATITVRVERRGGDRAIARGRLPPRAAATSARMADKRPRPADQPPGDQPVRLLERCASRGRAGDIPSGGMTPHGCSDRAVAVTGFRSQAYVCLGQLVFDL